MLVNWIELPTGAVIKWMNTDKGYALGLRPSRINSTQKEQLADIGFIQTQSGGFIRYGQDITLKTIADIFPGSKAIKVNREKIWHGTPPTPKQALNIQQSKELPEVSLETALPDLNGATPLDMAWPMWEPAPSGTQISPAAHNKYQARYIPKSKGPRTDGFVPLHMAIPTQEALDNLESRVGDIDLFVGEALNYSKSRMFESFSAEQIDALALSIDMSLQKRPFLLMDKTGRGKGRVVAGLALAAINAGRPFVFFTIKANLLSDIWRDLKDIGADTVVRNPLIMNGNTKMVDYNTDPATVVARAPKKAELEEIMATGRLPENCNFFCATYSQVRKIGSTKYEFLRQVARGVTLALDEAQEISGDSLTAKVFDEAMTLAHSGMYSSATPAVTPAHMAAFSAIMPPLFAGCDITPVLKQGGLPLQEAMTLELARDGALVRREHDITAFQVNLITSEGYSERDRQAADMFGPIVRIGVEMSALLKAKARTHNKNEEKRISKSTGAGVFTQIVPDNFATRLGLLSRQLFSVLTTEKTAQVCIDTLLEDKKPVIVVDNTLESLAAEGVLKTPDDPRAAQYLRQDEALCFRKAMRIALFRSCYATLQTFRLDEGKGKKPVKIKSERVFTSDEIVLEMLKNAQELIDNFPHVPLSPIDQIFRLVEEKGERLFAQGKIQKPWRVSEISGRSTAVINGELVKRNIEDRNEIIAGFNSGSIDLLAITKAGSTGLSLHASKRVADQRIRRLFEHDIPANPREREQFRGRVDRLDQVVTPEFGTIVSAIPAQKRWVAVQDHKLSKLAAQTSGTTETGSKLEMPDLLTPLGNQVAIMLMEDRPDHRKAMMMPASQHLSGTDYVEELLRRLIYLPIQEQEEIYEELIATFKDVEKEANSNLLSHGRVHLPGQWKEVNRTMFQAPQPAGGPVFGRPVYLSVIEQVMTASPVRTGWIKRKVKEAQAHRDTANLEALMQQLTNKREAFLEAQLPDHMHSVQEALDKDGANPVKVANRRLDTILNLLRRLKPGFGFSFYDTAEQNYSNAIILNITYPDIEHASIPSRYMIEYVRPGDGEPLRMSFAMLATRPELLIFQDSTERPFWSEFDLAPEGEYSERRLALTGNMFAAVYIAQLSQAGSSVFYENENGALSYAVLIPKGREENYRTMSGWSRTPSQLIEILRWSDIEIEGGPFTLQAKAQGVEISIAEGWLEDLPEEIDALLEGWRSDVEEGVGRDLITMEQAHRLIEALIKEGHTFALTGEARELLVRLEASK